MNIYEYLLCILLQGPIISLFQFCFDHKIDYSWTYEQSQRAKENGHITVRKMQNVRGNPVRLEITPRGRKFAESIVPRSFKFGAH